jgi:hypothetical protein
MARTVSEISKSIKAAFVADETLKNAYSLETGKSFDEQFSRVSIEGIVIYIVALAHNLIERVMDTFSAEIDARINATYLGSIPWFYQKVLDYQHGYLLSFNPQKYTFEYSEVNESAKVIKYAAVRQVEDTITKLKIYVANVDKEPITTDQLTAFQEYMRRVGPAGIHYEFVNENADLLNISIQVIFDPLILNSSGQKLTDGSYPVREAIQAYIDGITFGGIFNKTRLIDAIQSAEGVVDIILIELEHSEYGGSFSTVTGQNVESSAGAFIVDSITDTYTPNV